MFQNGTGYLIGIIHDLQARFLGLFDNGRLLTSSCAYEALPRMTVSKILCIRHISLGETLEAVIKSSSPIDDINKRLLPVDNEM